MPGIYINDGGATSSALGNILGGIATNLGPEAAAKAQLLKEQTEQADWNNRLLSSQVPLAESAAGSVGGLLRGAGADFGAAPGAAPGTVAGDVAAVTQPPTLNTAESTKGSAARGVVNPNSLNDWERYVANEVLAGRMPPEALKTAINIGQSQTRGPGGTDAAIATRSTMPLGPGQIVNTTGQPGGPTIGGGSTYTHAGDEASGTADIGQANTDLETGNAARANLGKVGPLVDLYNSVIAPEATLGGKMSQTVKEKLADYFKVPVERFDDPAAAKALIKTQLLSFVGGLLDLAGHPMPRNSLDLIASQIPDPTIDPNGFLASMNWVKAHLQAQANNAAAAQHFIETRQSDPNAGPAYHAQRGANAGEEGRAYSASGLRGGAGEGGGDGGGASGQVYVFPDEASMDAAGAAGNLPDGARIQLGYGPKATTGKYKK